MTAGVRPRVLVLLAAYNGAAWIEEQVASILAQVDVDVRLVVGDDASTDDSLARLQARWGGDERVRLMRHAKGTGSAGANFLRLFREVDAGTHDHVAFADQDDVWFPDKLAAAVATLARQDAVGCSAAVRAFWPDGRESVLAQDPRTRRADFLFEGAGQGCTFVLRRAFFERVQGFVRADAPGAATLHFHDWFVYLLARCWGGRWAFDPVPRMAYRQHGGNDIGARGGRGARARRLGMIRDGWYAAQVRNAQAIYLRAGGADPAVLRLGEAVARGRDRGVVASVALAARVWRDGRRRAADRAVLVVCALLRWI